MALQTQSTSTPSLSLQIGPSPVGLWQKALAALDDDLKATLDFKSSTKRDILEKTLKTAEDKRQLCLRKRWKIRIRGKDVVVRDVLEKIVKWLDHFKAIGDVTAQYDPTHTALAWAGVRFLLMVVVSGTHIYGSTVLGLETVSHLITRYSIVERVHLQRNTTASAELESLLTGLYAELLIFLAKAKKYFETPTAVRMLKSTMIAYQNGEDQQLQSIASLDAKISAIAALSDAETLNRLRDLDQPIHRVADQVAIYAQSLEAARYRKILDWLSPAHFIEHHRWHSERRLQGSGQWLLECREYLDWQASSVSSIFLLYGMAGSGKTILASTVVDSVLLQASKQTSPVLVAYFYCSKNASEVERSDPNEIMRSLVRQLSVTSDRSKTIHSTVLQDYERREADAEIEGFDVARLSLEDCVRLILKITGPDPATIIVDAIDEIQPRSRYGLIKALNQISRESSSVVKIFATSRHDDQVLSLLSNASMLRIDAETNHSDMKSFVNHQLAMVISDRRLLGGEVSRGLEADMSQALIDGAGEMWVKEVFQLVVWQIEKLCDMRHESDVRKSMLHLSKDTLDRLYLEIFEDIRKAEARSSKIATHAFSLLLCLRETISPDSFLTALASIHRNHEDVLQLPQLLRICVNLITYDSNTNVLRFAHTTVQDFLEAQPEFATHETNRILATACLNSCLYSSPVTLGPEPFPIEHFYHYGVLYWAEHCKIAFTAKGDPGLLWMAQQFMYDDEGISLPFIGWLEDAQEYAKVLPLYHSLKRSLSAIGSDNDTPFFTLCAFGLATLLESSSKVTSFKWNQRNDRGQTGLYLACSCGHLKTVRFLLEHDVDVNIGGGRFGTPLQAACFEGYSDIVKLLIENSADLKGKGVFPDALQASIAGNREDIAVMLLQNGFNVIDRSEYDQLLQEASQTGHVKVVDHLQRTYGSFFGSLGSSKCKAIYVAISKGQIGSIERFMRKTLNPRIEFPADSIAIAALSGHDNIITLLLHEGFNAEHPGQFGSPLRSASLRGHESTARLLLDRNVNTNANSSVGNALEAAAMNGHVSVANMLLEEGADPNSKGGSYGTALQAAAYRGHLKVAALLLNAGADVHMAGTYKDAFHAAVAGGHESLVQYFLDRGFRNYLDFGGFQYCKRLPSPPSTYTRSSSPEYRTWSRLDRHGKKKSKISKHISLRGRSIQRFTKGRGNGLEEAASKGCLRVVELYLKNLYEDGLPRSVSCLNNSLEIAAENGHEDIARCLLSRDLPKAPYLQTALRAAAKNGHIRAIDTLITYGQMFPRGDGRTAEDVNECCTEVERIVLLPGCVGNHSDVVTYALDLIRQRFPSTDMTRIHSLLLQETSRSNSDRVMDLMFNVAQFDNSEIFKAITLSCACGSNQALRRLLSHYSRDSASYETLSLEILNQGLYEAALGGHVEVVKTLIQEGVLADTPVEVFPSERLEKQPTSRLVQGKERDKIHQTALQAALSGFQSPFRAYARLTTKEIANREAIILLLLERGAKINELDEGSDHLLDIAVRMCSDRLVKSVIDNDASLMTPHSRKMSTLQNAVRRKSGAAPVLKILLQAGGYLMGTSNSASAKSELYQMLDQALEYLPLSGSSMSVRDVLYTGPGAVVKMLIQLLSMEKIADDRYVSLLQMAISVNDREWTNFLLGRGLDVNTQGGYYGTALQCAARFGNLEYVQLLLESGAEVNILKGEHGTALRAAVLGGHERVVDILLQYGANVNLGSSRKGSKSFDDAPILQVALESPNSFIIKSLVTAGADLHAELFRLPPLLIIACALGDLAIVRLFLDNKVEVGLGRKREKTHYPISGVVTRSSAGAVDLKLLDCDSNWYQDKQASALHMACSQGHHLIVEALLEHGADVDLQVETVEAEGYFSRTPLQAAVCAGHLSTVQSLIKAGAKIDHFNVYGTALYIASKKKRPGIVKELLFAKATIIDPFGRWNVLAEACLSRSYEIVEILLDELPEMLEKRACSDAISAAASANDDSIFQLLLGQDIPLSPFILSQACAASLHGSVSMLLQRGVDVDGDDGEGGRALQVASYRLQETTVNILLEHGADTNTTTSKYGSSLQAALEGLKDRLPFKGLFFTARDLAAGRNIVRVLLAKGADPNAAPGSFGAPLHLAAFTGEVPIVQELLENGADLNCASDRFGTALLAAIECHSPDMVKYLLSAGINVHHVSNEHGTALHYACYKQNVEIVRFLLDYGADPEKVCGSHGTPLTASISSPRPQIPRQDELDRHRDIAKILLRCGNYTQISEHDLLLAVNRMSKWNMHEKNPATLSYGQEVVELLLYHDENLRATEAVILAAVERFGPPSVNTLRLLLQRSHGAGIKEAMLESAKCPEIMTELLEHRPRCLITPDVVCNLSKNFMSSHQVPSFRSISSKCKLIRLLLDHENGMPIRQTVFSAILDVDTMSSRIGTDSERSSLSQQLQDLVEYLFERNPELEVTSSAVIGAVNANILEILLKHAPNMTVTPEMLSAAAGFGRKRILDASERHNVLLLLMMSKVSSVPQSLAESIPITDWTTETLHFVDVLLERAPDLQLSHDIFNVIIGWIAANRGSVEIKKEYLKLLLRNRMCVNFTGDICRKLEKTKFPDPELKGLLYRLEDKETGEKRESYAVS